jgi:hypothetical protein
MLRGTPFETPPAAAPQDKGRVSKHAQPRCSQLPDGLECRGAKPERGRLDAAAAVRDIPFMIGCARIVATTTTIPLGGMSGGRAR